MTWIVVSSKNRVACGRVRDSWQSVCHGVAGDTSSDSGLGRFVLGILGT